MAKSKYLTAPIPSTRMPRSVPYILVNETAERFSFYGMSSILVVFMTHYLMGPGGVRAVMSEDQSKEYFHLFNFAVYFMPLIGALISDIWLGKFRTIIFFSLVYCLGFVTLVLDLTRFGLALGLVLIAVGSGIIKPCVSANVGDQFGKSNKHLLSKVYSWFYFAINLGACVSMLLCPWLLDKWSPRVGFGVPAIFMFVATAAYWLGRRKFVHIPVAGIESVKNTLRGEPIRALGRLC
ncbi:MAG: POT-type proton-dependent oligopeptide transporter, partial [Planctomycetota bacterium]